MFIEKLGLLNDYSQLDFSGDICSSSDPHLKGKARMEGHKGNVSAFSLLGLENKWFELLK